MCIWVEGIVLAYVHLSLFQSMVMFVAEKFPKAVDWPQIAHPVAHGHLSASQLIVHSVAHGQLAKQENKLAMTDLTEARVCKSWWSRLE
jgi:hypothetical protein